ncbi:hypothetical protein F2Q65_14000 [Thiohalocapsa marina]|uniref:Uncharacterized protein n=1 Tax=Thiohalocapsa marina TaxID=424902 RepID=A0A5M8FIW0_9GAMM|nr:hypothetical protein [Thiohalocapsa marina]KAA6183920.1 hypothetical protein F2Q65_14000 [Thiohalocapsa marina]
MQAIEFEANIQDGAIKLPSQYHAMESKHVKVVAWVEDSVANDQTAKPHQEQTPFFADGYIDQHWRELIITTSPNPLEDDDAVLQEDYGAYLSAKHSS